MTVVNAAAVDVDPDAPRYACSACDGMVDRMDETPTRGADEQICAECREAAHDGEYQCTDCGEWFADGELYNAEGKYGGAGICGDCEETERSERFARLQAEAGDIDGAEVTEPPKYVYDYAAEQRKRDEAERIEAEQRPRRIELELWAADKARELIAAHPKDAHAETATGDRYPLIELRLEQALNGRADVDLVREHSRELFIRDAIKRVRLSAQADAPKAYPRTKRALMEQVYAWVEAHDLTATDAAVAFAMASFANGETRELRTSGARLAKRSCTTAQTLRRARQRLVDAGLITRTRQGSSNTTSVYHFPISHRDTESPSPRAQAKRPSYRNPISHRDTE